MTNIAGGVNITSLVANTTTTSSNADSVNSDAQFSSILAFLEEPATSSAPGRMTDAQVSSMLANNPSATPQQIYDYMKQSGIDINQLSRVTGNSVSTLANTAISSGITDNMLAQIGYSSPAWTSPFQANEYNSYTILGNATASGPTRITDTQVKQWLADNPNADIPQIMGTAQQHGVTLDQISRVYGVIPDVLIQKAAQEGINVTAYTNSDLGWKSVATDSFTFAARLADVGPLQLPGLLDSAGITDAPSMTQMYGDTSESSPEGAIYWAYQILTPLSPVQRRSLQDTYYAWMNQQIQQNTNGISSVRMA